MVLELKRNYKIVLLLSWMILIGYLLIFSQGCLVWFDMHVYQFLSSLQNPILDNIMIGMTYIGSTISIVTICCVCILIMKRQGVWISIYVAGSALINQMIKVIVKRERPSVLRLIVESGYSFPSAHAMVSMTLFGCLAYVFWQKQRRLSILLLILALMIGITRIYVGVHYASDVIAGFLFAITYLITIHSLFIYHKRSSES